MKQDCVHYDGVNEPRLIVLLSKTIVEDMYMKTDKGLLIAATLFPISMITEIAAHHLEVLKARQATKAVEAKIYGFLNLSSKWRRGEEV